ncbi:cytochrome c [Kordia sp. YSTF-M3]|uniref:Cytochrome c n=1 Tax=Kordia aestuariivivens TaxID=2759037 RepID=A0ABR7Q9J6_9FLAO|nr:cytochrome c [Kordia aestuariivivens]MBC8755235.1 cytochrome c [Kordia aestuariivivens]
MKIAVSIFIFIISAGMAILFLVNVKEQKEIYAQQPVFVCGNAFFDTETSEEARQGKSLFNANCAACHKLDTQSTGPPLRNINERYTSEAIIKFIRNDFSGEIKYTNERGYKCTSFPDLSDDAIKNILSYTN